MNFMKCIEIYVDRKKNHKSRYNLREVYINPNKILFVTEDKEIKSMLDDGIMDDLSKDHEFTRVALDNGTTVSIVGSIETVLRKVI
tara:strand:- start:701 stop:958 length:258 start_codon:yes stop_codon:yes gene_type:complete